MARHPADRTGGERIGTNPDGSLNLARVQPPSPPIPAFAPELRQKGSLVWVVFPPRTCLGGRRIGPKTLM